MGLVRVIAIPLARGRLPRRLPNPGNALPTVYYQFQQSDLSSRLPAVGRPARRRPLDKASAWVTTKANEIWAGFGKAQGGWKLKLYRFGERLVDRMEFEELALKGVDPSLGPTIAHPDLRGAGKDVKDAEHTPRIPILFPSSINSGSTTLKELGELLAFRAPRHWKGFLTWMILAPFTAPFILIPVIPNIPFFFCAWRSWSHYRAYRASQYLQSLLDAGVLVPEPHEKLDAVYKERAPQNRLDSEKVAESDTNNASKHTSHHPLLLTSDALPIIAKILNFDAAAVADLRRAFHQAEVRIGSGRPP